MDTARHNDNVRLLACLRLSVFRGLSAPESSGAHTQHIERLWRDVRGGIPRFGRSQKHVVGYLAEFIFKRKFPDHRDRIHAFFTAISQLYPPSR